MAEPVATVRRIGETRDEQRYRAGSPLARSASLAFQREKEANDVAQAERRLNIDEQNMALRQREFDAEQSLSKTAMADKKAELDQFSSYMNEEDQIAQKYGRSSREFLANTLAVAKKYPLAIRANPRLADKFVNYSEKLVEWGGHPDLPTALWEASQFDPNSLPPDKGAQYLGEIIAKYPAVAGDKAFSSLLDEKRKAVNSLGAMAQAKEAGVRVEGATVDTPGGSLRMGKEKDTILPSLEKERSMQAKFLDRAKRLRASAEKAGSLDLKNDADADIKEAEAALSDIESQIRSVRTGAGGAKPPNTPPTTVAAPGGGEPNPKPAFVAGTTATKNGITYVRGEDGKWLPK